MSAGGRPAAVTDRQKELEKGLGIKAMAFSGPRMLQLSNAFQVGLKTLSHWKKSNSDEERAASKAITYKTFEQDLIGQLSNRDMSRLGTTIVVEGLVHHSAKAWQI